MISPTSNSNSDAPPPAAPKLPMRAVTLFSAGVAYLLREGEMPSGEQEAVLTFRTTQINDLLKSLVLLDANGTVQAVTYPSRDPVGRTLQSFAVKVTENIGRADLLKQLRGVPVQVETVSGETLTGRVVGVEEAEETVSENGYRTTTKQTLVVLGENGMVSAPMETVRVLRILDERLDKELRDALTALAFGSDDARRTVTLRFSGDTTRTVQVGYLVEAPLWKVSYRLVMDAAENDDNGSQAAAKPYLQGWAMVENTTDEDWEGVQLSLVSGRPVSFIQDLYQPLYVPRPVVPPDVIASPFPQTHAGDLGVPGGGAASMSTDIFALEEASDTEPGGMMMRSRAASYAAAPASVPMPAPMMAVKRGAMQASTPNQAEARSVGELFQYDVSAPVRLPRQQAALLPIVSEDVEGEKLSLFNADRDPRFPMNAVRLKNNTNLHLKGGPVTLFDGGTYAGEARMEDVPPGDSRLLTYAVDLAVECEKQDGSVVRRETLCSIKRGVLNLSHRQTREARYTFKNKAKKNRLVLVEHPFASEWALTSPETPAERTAAYYRFSVPVPAGTTETLLVSEEQPVSQTVALLSDSLSTIGAYAEGGSRTRKSGAPPSEALQAALVDVVARRVQIDQTEADAQACEKERDALMTEQERIRANMGALDKGSALYRRYTDELDKQETRLGELRTEIIDLRTHADRLLRDLRGFLDGLSV